MQMSVYQAILFLLATGAARAFSPNVVILGGTGKIGTAVATHLLRRLPGVQIQLVGRRSPQQGESDVQEVLKENPSAKVSYTQVETIWKESPQLEELFAQADCVVHTAGPYLDQKPVPLILAIQSERCKAYVDVSDPLPYIETSLLMDAKAKSSGTTALVAAGAFPGMSNVMAVEAASKLGGRAQDVRFHYFTAGLGGSGAVNLYITNLGFGEPMVQFDQGELQFFMALSGRILGKVDFFLSQLKGDAGNERARERVGTRTVFAWPFPEAATAAQQLKARGNSYAAMGTAPDVWNTMLGILVSVVPRPWWKNKQFSKFMADFSQPMVSATDAWLKWTGIGEMHAMRIDVTTGRDEASGVSIVQAHDSFRQCVGQSCTEFTLDILLHPNQPGVYLPEQRYQYESDRRRIVEKLTSTPGTFCYTGPVRMKPGPRPPT